MTRILIVDDHRLIRKMIRDFLKNEAGWVVCGESADGQEAVRHAETLRPHVIILDFQKGLWCEGIFAETSRSAALGARD